MMDIEVVPDKKAVPTVPKKYQVIHYIWKDVLAVLAIAAILVVGFSLMLFFIASDSRKIREKIDNFKFSNLVFKKGAYHFDLSGHFFVVPKAYMQLKRYERKLGRYVNYQGGIAHPIGFYALLPDWEPYHSNSDSEKVFLVHPNRVSVSLDITGRTKKEMHERWYKFSYTAGKESSMKHYDTPPKLISWRTAA